MAFEWHEFLAFAETLKESNNQAALRSCISRAYYAAFGTAEQRLAFNGVFVPPKANRHLYVWWYYDASNIQNSHQTILQVSADLKRKRTNADYKETIDVTCNIAKQAVLQSQKLIESIIALEENFSTRSDHDWQNYRASKID